MRALIKYAIKNTNASLWQKFYYSDFLDPLYNFIKFFRIKYETLERMLFWGWKMRHNYDFDGQYVYATMYLKLERTHRCMKEDGHLMWNADHESNLMRKLAECKMLAKKLSQYNYARYTSVFHDVYCREGKSGFLGKSMAKFHPDARPISSNMYRAFFLAAIASDNKEKSEDKKRLYFLLDKYLEHWWD